jgi:hypothetical protein
MIIVLMDDRERKDSVISKIYYDYANMGAMSGYV